MTTTEAPVIDLICFDLPRVAAAGIAGPQPAHCANDDCREYRKTGRRRFCGELLPGCRAQCRSCGSWVVA